MDEMIENVEELDKINKILAEDKRYADVSVKTFYTQPVFCDISRTINFWCIAYLKKACYCLWTTVGEDRRYGISLGICQRETSSSIYHLFLLHYYSTARADFMCFECYKLLIMKLYIHDAK